MNRLICWLLVTVSALFCYSQHSGKKPKVMVVPEEAFCINSGYFSTDANGKKIPDYKAALNDENILDVINTFENLMAGYGFPLNNLQQELNDLNEDKSLSFVMTSKDDSNIVEDYLDQISRVASSDILIKIAPVVSQFGPQKRMKLRVSSIDCASKKAIKSFGPIERTSAGSTSSIFKAAVSDNIESFLSGLVNYFSDIREKGREGTLIVKVSETCPLNIESDITYLGESGELGDLIDLWVNEHAVNGMYTGGKVSRYGMNFDQVRIPLTGKGAFGKDKSLTMEDFVKGGLTQLLAEYGISVATHAVGIGKVYLILGAL